MMKVEFGSKALKYLSKLDAINKKRVFNKIKKLEENPFPKGFKKMKGEKNAYRIQVYKRRIKEVEFIKKDKHLWVILMELKIF